MSPLPSRSLRLCVVLCWGGGVSLCVPPCVSAAAPLGVITPLRVSHCTCGGTRRSFRGMIDLLSYTTMDLHAAWPVAGCRSSSRLLGVCVSSSSTNVMSGSRQLCGTLFLVVASRSEAFEVRGCMYPHHGVPSTGRGLASCRNFGRTATCRTRCQRSPLFSRRPAAPRDFADFPSRGGASHLQGVSRVPAHRDVHPCITHRLATRVRGNPNLRRATRSLHTSARQIARDPACSVTQPCSVPCSVLRGKGKDRGQLLQ